MTWVVFCGRNINATTTPFSFLDNITAVAYISRWMHTTYMEATETDTLVSPREADLWSIFLFSGKQNFSSSKKEANWQSIDSGFVFIIVFISFLVQFLSGQQATSGYRVFDKRGFFSFVFLPISLTCCTTEKLCHFDTYSSNVLVSAMGKKKVFHF